MQLIGDVVATVMDGQSQLTRAGREAVNDGPRRPHLYKKRKGGPATERHRFRSSS